MSVIVLKPQVNWAPFALQLGLELLQGILGIILILHTFSLPARHNKANLVQRLHAPYVQVPKYDVFRTLSAT